MESTDKIKHIAIVGVLAGMLVMTGCEKKPSAGGSSPTGNQPEVGVVVISPEPVTLTEELSGRVSPHLLAEVRPQVEGIILKRFFTEGANVKAGQVLYQIDPATYQAAANMARAALARAEANLLPARLKEERFRELVKINAVSQQDYDDVNAAYKQSAADVDIAKAATETAHINLAYTSITAPISGRIGRSEVTTGALVTASQAAPLATIQQLDPVYVDVTQSAADLLRLKRNISNGLLQNTDPEKAEVKLLLEDGTPYPLPGTMKFSDVTVNQDTGSVTLRTVFPNPDELLLPGLFVRAIVVEGRNEQAILVPQRGVTRNPDGQAMVMLVGADEKVEPRIIMVERTIGDKWLVNEGLQRGDRVILEGTQRARPGAQVKAVPFDGTPAAAPAVAPQPAAKK